MNTDFGIHVVKIINVFGVDVRITETLVNSLIIMGVMILIALIIRISISKWNMIPSGMQNVVEALVEGIDKFTISTMGEKHLNFAPYYGTILIYILMCNLSGLFIGPNYLGLEGPIYFMRPPTADIALTFALALITFFMVQGFGIKEKGVGKWAKGLTEPMWPLTPLNIVGELANPISLSFRLFGNILGGTIIMGLFYNLPWFVLLGIPTALHGYFDVFAGVLQAVIFVMLSMTFVSSAMD